MCKDLSVLESEWRKRILPVEPLIEKIEILKDREIAFDIGAGTGYFTVHLAKMFKRVYAVEVNPEAVKILANKGVENIGIILSEKPPEIDFEVDFVLFADSLHEIEDREGYVEWVKRHAKAFAVIDWKRNECTDIGPPLKHRIDEDEVIGFFEDAFELERIDAYKCHFFVFGVRI